MDLLLMKMKKKFLFNLEMELMENCQIMMIFFMLFIKKLMEKMEDSYHLK